MCAHAGAVRTQKRSTVNLWTQTLSLLTPLSHWLVLLFLEVILSANISSCSSFPAIQLCFTAGKHATVCLVGFVVRRRRKKSKFKGETVFGWLNVTGCSSAAELIMGVGFV